MSKDYRSVRVGRYVTAAVLAAVIGMSSASVAHGAAVTDETVAEAAASAKSVEDHQALAAYFTAKSKAALAEVENHRKMASALGKGKQAGGWEAHCHSLMKTYQAQADDYAALAKEQEALAKGMQMK